MSIDNLGQIARNLKKPCPLALVEALLDKNSAVNEKANQSISFFSRFAPGSMEVLKRCAKADSWIVRNQSVFIFARVGANDKEAVEAIANAKNDPKFEVRYSAHMAMYHINGKLDELLIYLIRLAEEPKQMLSPMPEDLETRKREDVLRDVFSPHKADDLLGMTGKRPEELAPVLVKRTYAVPSLATVKHT